jgi:ketosteroid isomerase-like protein
MRKLLVSTKGILLLSGLFLLATTHGDAAQPRAAREAIAALNKQFEEAFFRADVAAIGRQYSRDAESFFDGEDIVRGREAIANRYKKDVGAGGKKTKVQTLEVSEHGDWAYETGKQVVTGPDGKVEYDGKYLIIWRREAGKWKIYREVGNSNRPKPGK